MQSGKEDRGAREEILGRVRAAVRAPAPRQQSGSVGPIFATVTDPLERFQSECAANHTDVVLAANGDETVTALHRLLASLPPGEIFVQDTPELRRLTLGLDARQSILWSSGGPPPESSQVAISHCEALVGQTGSVLVSSHGCGGRGASIVAPCHVIVASADQIVPDLEAALARARQIAFGNSFVGLITGCSRTSDIEKRLIIGAHGPRRVVVIVRLSSGPSVPEIT
jgi:L-lactate dehydrogenase complex protein LldG